MSDDSTAVLAPQEVVVLTSFSDVRAALYSRDLARAAGRDFDDYVKGNVLEDSVVTLHGEAHQLRRKAVAPHFSREVRTDYETEMVSRVIREFEVDGLFCGDRDLVSLGREFAIGFAASTAGVDFDTASAASRRELLAYTSVFAEGGAIEDSLRHFGEVIADVSRSLDGFESDFFSSSWNKRVALLSQETHQSPRDLDVLASLIAHQEALGLTRDIIRRETAIFLAAGTDTTAQSITNLIHEALNWCEDHPEDRQRLVDDPLFLQRFFHEVLRVRPTLPSIRRRALTDVQIGETFIPAGAKVQLDFYSAGRDPMVYGETAFEFDPLRELPKGVPSFGFAFSAGIHTCPGRALASGAPLPEGHTAPEGHLYGLVPAFSRELLRRGVFRASSAAGKSDPGSARWTKWLSYDVSFPADRSQLR